MPQKRNPVPLEHVRVLASRALSEAHGVLNTLHNTPFADMNDGEDSLQPLVALAFTDADRAMKLLAGALDEAGFHTGRMRERAQANFLTVTEVADTLVRRTGISFHQAHSVVSATVRSATSDNTASLARELHHQAQQQGLAVTLQDLEMAMDPEHFISVRSVIGGPAPAALDPELERATRQRLQDHGWLHMERSQLLEREQALLAEAAAIASEATA